MKLESVQYLEQDFERRDLRNPVVFYASENTFFI